MTGEAVPLPTINPLVVAEPAREPDLVVPPPHQRKTSLIGRLGAITLRIGAALFALWYINKYLRSVRNLWFHHAWTTDDDLQQTFPFHRALHPDIFQGDIIYEVMKGYLAPLHYWLGMALTRLTESPIMATHWITLIQLVLTAVPLFFAVRALAGSIPGFISVAWLFHTREIIQRINGGLPRGWAAPVLAGFVYLVVTRRHRWILVLLLAGALAHPPSTGLVGLAYGMLLVSEWGTALVKRDREAERVGRKRLIELACVAPILLGILLAVVHRPEEVGQMVSYEEALTKPEFSRPGGRFPFVPLLDIGSEVRSFGFQAFISRLYRAPQIMKRSGAELVIAVLLLVVLIGRLRGRTVASRELWFCFIGTISMYMASRAFAFKLYVPNRHLQFPLAIFSIVLFSVGVWRVLYRGPDPKAGKFSEAWASILGLVLLGAFVVYGSGEGLQGPANFNYSLTKKGKVFVWLNANTPENALIAGEPTHIDAVQLFAMRTAFATTETAHPFYDKYYALMEKRMRISLRAHYAQSAREFLDLLRPEGISYFVFMNRAFKDEALATPKYFVPLDSLIRELAARPKESFFFSTLSTKIPDPNAPFVVFRDSQSTVIDLRLLESSLTSSGT